AALEQILFHYEPLLMIEQGYLAHGDFDTSHIYQQDGRFTGIIDFGEIRGTSHWYDLGHFHMRDGEALPYRVLPELIRGYEERIALPSNSEPHIFFTSVLINVRALAGSLQKRPANCYTRHQLEVLREDVSALQYFL
ncbi:MAG TPA: phosphotransferase, partial [Ktedonobacteraceae bacterium]